ncbi:MAG: hypothetical protein ACLUFV_00065 [Acutalibacteraceae bacterium]
MRRQGRRQAFDADAAAELLSSLRTMIDENAFVEYEGPRASRRFWSR